MENRFSDSDARGFVVVHGGARDSYQVALALAERGKLHRLVTDLFLSQSRLHHIARWLPKQVTQLLASRHAAGLRRTAVTTCGFTGLLATVCERMPRLPFRVRRAMRRLSDHRIGNCAGRMARRDKAPLLAYSYFASAAFRSYGKPALLFQVHPHPLTVQRILREELVTHPECAASLNQEWELALPTADFEALVEESTAAQNFIVASSFTRQSLVEHGVAPGRIQVVPYGIDLDHFHPARSKAPSATLRLLFVGRINQRKGLAYLLQALDLLKDVTVHLTICGRVVDDLALFAPYRGRVTIRPFVSAQELVSAYQQADLFVFPSVAEGFGQVLLEALASGLPILSTTHTAAPDLIQNGVQGWIVEPRRADQLAERIRWAAAHPDELLTMAHEARRCAEQFTWARFREGVASFALSHASPPEEQGVHAPAPVVLA